MEQNKHEEMDLLFKNVIPDNPSNYHAPDDETPFGALARGEQVDNVDLRMQHTSTYNIIITILNVICIKS